MLCRQRCSWLAVAAFFYWSCVLFPGTAGAVAPGDEPPLVRVVYESDNAFGHLEVTERDLAGSNLTVTTYTFTDADGVTQVFQWNPQTGLVTLVFPSGYAYWRTLSSGIVTATFETRSGQSWQVNLYPDGTPVDQADVDNLNAALQALSPGSYSAWSLFHDFGIADGLITDNSDGAVTVTQDAKATIGCAASVIGLAASYVGLAACIPLTAGIGCWAAIVGHTAAVAGLVSCF